MSDKRLFFVRLEEEGTGPYSIFIVVREGDTVQASLADYIPGASLLSSWEVPKDLKNLVSDGSLRAEFEALLGLDGLAFTPVVSDLFATIFEMGYRQALADHGLE